MFFLEVYARTSRATTLRTYAYALLDWYRFLHAGGIAVHEVRRAHVTAYIASLKGKNNPQRRTGAKSVGQGVNPATGKRELPEGYQASTINMRLTVVAMFYTMLQQAGVGPEHHPVSRVSRRLSYPTQASPAYHGMIRSGYVRQAQPQRLAHALPRPLLEQFRKLAACPRDAALIEGLYSSAARVTEMLALRIGDVKWEKQQIMLQTKGREGTWPVTVSAKFLELLRVYLDSREDQLDPDAPVWVMRRGSARPLTYTALRAVLRRLNDQLGSNVTAHDFRATSATHLAENPRVPFLAIQNHLRHSHPGSTHRYVMAARPNSALTLRDHFERTAEAVTVAPEYDSAVLSRVLRHQTEKR